MKIVFLAFLVSIGVLTQAYAYPEFQIYSKKVSGRSVNCSMCHMNSDGPVGLKSGQIGILNEDELKALGMARQAFKPDNTAKNPVLNEFGNLILNQLGKEKLALYKDHPEMLFAALSKTSDLDKDGIIDAQEFEDGTHPLNVYDGRPLKLLKNNFKKNIFHIFMLVLATAFGLFGLSNALLWLSSKMKKE